MPRDNEKYHQELERRVEERTRQLLEQVREREAAEKLAIYEKIRAERYLDVAEAITLELDPRGRIEIINKWGSEILGYPIQELIGRDWFDVAIPPERRNAIREIFHKTISGDVAEFEYVENEIITRKGERRHIAWHNLLRCTEDGHTFGTLSFGLDITDRKEADNSLRMKQKDLDHAQAVARIGNWRLDVHRNELVWSDEAYRIFGIKRGAPLTYEAFLNFIHPDDRSYVDSQWSAALEGKPYDIDHRIVVDGIVKWVREKAELEFGGDGTLLGGFGTVQDITDRKQLEFDLLSFMRSAEEANRVKSRFLANMSHELRTPLTVIVSALELISKNIAAPERQRLVEMANDSANRLLRIIAELLDFSSIDAGQLKIEDQSFDLRKCIQQSIEMFASLAREKGVEIFLTISPEIPIQIIGDPNRIGQVLINLLGNAVKFTESGTIEIIVTGHEKRINFTVHDTGIGIPPYAIGKLFERFTQADESMTRPYGGTGLGLAISKELVELMGGKIRAESEFGQGSAFSFTLPLKEFHQTP